MLGAAEDFEGVHATDVYCWMNSTPRKEPNIMEVEGVATDVYSSIKSISPEGAYMFCNTMPVHRPHPTIVPGEVGF